MEGLVLPPFYLLFMKRNFSLQLLVYFQSFSLESLYQRYCMVDELMCDRYIMYMCKCVDETVSLNYGVGLQFSMMQKS